MMLHMPGPWRVTKRAEDSTIPFAIEFPHPHASAVAPIADVRAIDICSQPMAEANALLIAAAPDLLEALQAMVDEWVDYTTLNKLGDPWEKHNMKLARAAIAKAKVPA